ncbi:MAG: septum formation protein Maf [Flavobacterium sp.]|nr:septum formation protein Maf [Flavobacterium sp.]
MLKEKLSKYKLILASGSPRRQQFFRDLDLDFEIRLKDVEEIFPAELTAGEITDYLAKLKASAFEGDLKPGEILITSDTIVWFEDKALGKPTDRQNAIDMLSQLSGKTHTVLTSVCFQTQTGSEVIRESTDVTFNELSLQEIEFYVDRYQPFDKAGSYGIQEWIGLIAVARIEGSYANVIGLPVDKVYQYLNNLPC